MSNQARRVTSCCGTRAESNSRCEGRPPQLYETNTWKHGDSPQGHTNKQCEVLRRPAIVTHGKDTSSSGYTAGGKTKEALELENPTLGAPSQGPTSPLRCDERGASTSAARLFCLFTFRITPCSSWTVFRCVLLWFFSNRISMRVVSGHVWLK